MIDSAKLISPVVSVIIVNYNGKHYLEKCLRGLKHQMFSRFETIIVDNGSKDGSASLIQKKYPEIELIILSENSGFSGANNIALDRVKTEFVALLNNDAVPDPLWLLRLVEALEENPEAGFAASKMLYYSNPAIIDRAGDGYTRAGAGVLRGRGQPSDSYDRKEWIFGACAGAAIYRKCMIEDIGSFDARFFLLYEDVDLSFRAQLSGYKCLYVPESIVYHMASEAIGYDSPTSIYYGHRNLEWVYIQNIPNSLIPKTITQHLIYDLLAFNFFLLKGQGKIFIKSKIDAIKDLKLVIQKRKIIQKKKKVEDHYIWNLFDKEFFFPRLRRRLKKKRQIKQGLITF